MLPNMLLGSFMPNSSRKKTVMNGGKIELKCNPLSNIDPIEMQTEFSLQPEDLYRKEGKKKVSKFSQLMSRVATSCMLNPLTSSPRNNNKPRRNIFSEKMYDYGNSDHQEHDGWNKEQKKMEMIMVEVFEAMSDMKSAYVRLQEARCQWDPEKMRGADVAVVSELRRLGVLRDRFLKSRLMTGSGGGSGGGGMLKEVVVNEMKKAVKEREMDLENLKEKLRSLSGNNNRKRGRSNQYSKRRVNCISHLQATSTQELFELTMSQVKETSNSFTSVLLSLMRSAHWDITATLRSIEASFTTTKTIASTSIHHAKYALESYVSRKIFQGFKHESFYIDGCQSPSLLHPHQFREFFFTQYQDMKAMVDPMQMLQILPTCHFGKFCLKKYLSIMHPKMEESLFGDLEQQWQILAGKHPRSEFYGEFLGMAKAVWLLHLLAFSFEPPPSHFEVSRGDEFHPQYMESVVKFSGGGGGVRVPVGQVVGFPVSPGFKFGNSSIIKSRVYLVSRI